MADTATALQALQATPQDAPQLAQQLAPQVAGPALEAEADDYGENDSALGDEAASSTTSISSSIYRYRTENGRTYHSFKGDDELYNFPNDDIENDRLDLQHHLFQLTYGGGRLYTAPIPKTKKLNRVLDIGTGTGIWAIDFADMYEEASVLGVDLSPIQPAFIPPNLIFQIDDVEEPWTYSTKFDFIHSRMMVGSIKDWPRLFQQSYENLNPGGWMELADITFPLLCDDDTLKPDSALKRWSDMLLESCMKIGRISNSALFYKDQMEDVGFVNVTVTIYPWPTNRWPRDRHFKEIGMWNNENMCGGVEALSMGLFTRVLGWSKAEVDVFLVDVRKDMKDTKIHSYNNIYVVCGQKPESKKSKEPEIEHETDPAVAGPVEAGPVYP